MPTVSYLSGLHNRGRVADSGINRSVDLGKTSPLGDTIASHRRVPEADAAAESQGL